MDVPELETIDLFNVSEYDVVSAYAVSKTRFVIKHVNGNFYTYTSSDSYATRVDFDEENKEILNIHW